MNKTYQVVITGISDSYFKAQVTKNLETPTATI